eukprot:RCo005847
MDNLSPEQGRAIQEMLVWTSSEASGDLVRRNRAWCDLSCIRRYLAACNWKVDKAKKALAATLKWRGEARPDALKTSDFPDICLKARYMYWNGYDQHGHPILYVHSQLHDCSLDREQRFRYALFMLEKGVTLMNKKFSGKEGVEQWVIVLDEAGRTRKNIDLAFIRKVGPIMGSHYVERLYRVYVIHPTSTFSALFKVASLFMDDVSRSKVVLSRTDQDQLTRADDRDPEKVLMEGEEGAGTAVSPLAVASPLPVMDLSSALPELLADLGQAQLQVSWGGKTPDITDFPAYYTHLQKDVVLP